MPQTKQISRKEPAKKGQVTDLPPEIFGKTGEGKREARVD